VIKETAEEVQVTVMALGPQDSAIETTEETANLKTTKASSDQMMKACGASLKTKASTDMVTEENTDELK